MNGLSIGIATNISGARGLAKDYKLLRDFLEELGHEVTGFEFDAVYPKDKTERVDLLISLETVCRQLMFVAPIHWLCVNPEWTKSHDLDFIGKNYSKIFCKTKEAYRIFSALFPDRAHYVGFMAEDHFNPNIPRELNFLHIGGNASYRGTQQVLDAWRWKRNGLGIGAELTIVSRALKEQPEIEGVRYLTEVSDEELLHLQNSHKFHIYPAGTEGFGQAIHEGMSCNAVILTTDAPPMNEIESAHLIPVMGSSFKYNMADIHEVSALDIHTAAREIFHFDQCGYGEDKNTRDEFLAGNAEFKNLFLQHLEELKPEVAAPLIRKHKEGKYRIAFIGNFSAEESTEQMIRWALDEGLGHSVELLQENHVELSQIERTAESSDLLLWVRTPGWLRVDDQRMIDFLDSVNIPTASIHLDLFWGIPEREALIGKIPFWRTSQVWTADGSRQEDFKSRNVNHFWMKPAANLVYAHPGRYRDEYRCNVGFVGCRTYHSEHNFRGELINFLERTYANRFKVIEGGLRGHDLNDFYASCKVCVGDCFGGGTIPNYWSDRMVETPMRHGFLLSPEIHGLDIPLATFIPKDLESLKAQIDYWLHNEEDRRRKIEECAEYVRQNDTWTARMTTILKQVLA